MNANLDLDIFFWVALVDITLDSLLFWCNQIYLVLFAIALQYRIENRSFELLISRRISPCVVGYARVMRVRGLRLRRIYGGLAFLAPSTENVMMVRIYHPYAAHLPADPNIAKALTKWRRSSGDHSPSRRHCDKHHQKHRNPSPFVPSTTHHSSNTHSSSDPQSLQYRHRKMSPSSSKLSDEDTNKQYTTQLPRATCDNAYSMAPASLAQRC